LEQGANVNERTVWGWFTPLHLALANGWKETAFFLVEKGANPEAKSKCGRNPAAYGAYRGYRQLAEEFRFHLRHLEEVKAASVAQKEREKLRGKNFLEQLL
jgi:ankyrin repeat protein